MSDGLRSTVYATLQMKSSQGLIWKGEYRGSETQARQWLADHLKTLKSPEPLTTVRASNALHNYRDYHTEVIGRCSVSFSITPVDSWLTVN